MQTEVGRGNVGEKIMDYVTVGLEAGRGGSPLAIRAYQLGQLLFTILVVEVTLGKHLSCFQRAYISLFLKSLLCNQLRVGSGAFV